MSSKGMYPSRKISGKVTPKNLGLQVDSIQPGTHPHVET